MVGGILLTMPLNKTFGYPEPYELDGNAQLSSVISGLSDKDTIDLKGYTLTLNQALTY